MNNDEPIAHVSEDGQMEQETCEIKRMLTTFIKKLRACVKEIFAHSVEGKPKSEWQGRQLLELFKQLKRFLRFERLINAGLWHDVEEI